MEKFGDIISMNTPVLICFCSEGIENSLRMDGELHEISTTLKDRVRIVKIGTSRDKELSKTLRINTLPTVIVLNNFSLVWRGEGSRDNKELPMGLDRFL